MIGHVDSRDPRHRRVRDFERSRIRGVARASEFYEPALVARRNIAGTGNRVAVAVDCDQDLRTRAAGGTAQPFQLGQQVAVAAGEDRFGFARQGVEVHAIVGLVGKVGLVGQRAHPALADDGEAVERRQRLVGDPGARAAAPGQFGAPGIGQAVGENSVQTSENPRLTRGHGARDGGIQRVDPAASGDEGRIIFEYGAAAVERQARPLEAPDCR
jgi:hypothetical protein